MANYPFQIVLENVCNGYFLFDDVAMFVNRLLQVVALNEKLYYIAEKYAKFNMGKNTRKIALP